MFVLVNHGSIKMKNTFQRRRIFLKKHLNSDTDLILMKVKIIEILNLYRMKDCMCQHMSLNIEYFTN